MNHNKHTRLQVPVSGNFGRNEYALMGAPCPVIQQLCLKIITDLSMSCKIGYVDADHRSSMDFLTPNKQVMNSGGVMELTNKLDYFQWHLKKELLPYDYRSMMNETDLVLVNGNHFEADKQILILDPAKFDSLSRNIDKLKKVVLVLTTEKTSDLPLFLKDYLPDHANLPILSISNAPVIAAFIAGQLEANKPVVQGLILTGGKSTRMGTDKSQLTFNGITQRERIKTLLQDMDIPCFFSCREDQKVGFSNDESVIVDTFLELGPMGGILSAFRSNPRVAWLILATDIPLLKPATLSHLVTNRRSSAIATAFINETSGFPEPLITIWEPKSYQVLLNFLGQGISCPRKVLINNDTQLLKAPDQTELMNVNNPEEYQQAADLLSSPK